ncbi:DUF3761 domain-containing protein [Asticcacaulis sp. BE141]|uniref:DUF3761 domain-containing protein n=1 Tax=Asticcacaulis sp. BE141 TaxID=2817848 RepID=UPI001AEA1DDA
MFTIWLIVFAIATFCSLARPLAKHWAHVWQRIKSLAAAFRSVRVPGALIYLVCYLSFALLAGFLFAPKQEAKRELQYAAMCADGTRSFSTGQGTCSWHGGVAYYY